MRVLVVEDDRDVVEAMTQLLELEGHEVESAVDGRAALQKLDGHGLPNLILLDIRMPVMDGFAFREAQLTDPRIARIPVVVLTADARAIEVSAMLKVEAILEKPVDPEELLDLVRRYS